MERILRTLLFLGLAALLPGLAAAEAKALPKGQPVFGADAALKMILEGKKISQTPLSRVKVEGQPFSEAIHLDCTAPFGESWDTQVTLKTEAPVEEGDVMLATFWARCTRSLQESGDGRSQFVFEKGSPDWAKSVEYDLRVPREWMKFQVRFKAAAAYKPAEAHVLFRLGYETQQLEFAGLEVVNYGKAVKLEDLPVTKITYTGMEPDAAWRGEALKRIDQIRRAPLTVKVTDKAGKPVAGAQVKAVMSKSAFHWGSCVAGYSLMGWGDSPAAQKYKDAIVKNFNIVTEENAFKWRALWGDFGIGFTKDTALLAHQFAMDNGLDFHGHVLAWPSWRQSPARLKDLVAGDPRKLQEYQLAHIRETMALTKGQALQWDVMNEPYDNHDFMDLAKTDDIMVDWFKEARQADPQAQLCINDYAILAGGGGNSAHRDHYEKTIKFLLSKGAPIDIIGMQGHFGQGLTPPTEMLKIMDRYAALGPALAITEYDITTDDEELAGRFTRDLLITAYSHPAMQTFISWGFWDGAHWKKNAPFYREDWSEKPSYKAWDELVNKAWKTRAQAKTGADGRAVITGHHGEYKVTVSVGGKKVSKTATLGKDGATVEIGL